jgi:hypothetical protein
VRFKLELTKWNRAAAQGMNARKKSVLTLIVFAGTLLPGACAQLATTQVGGLQISVDQVFLSGDKHDLDCSVAVKFGGIAVNQAVSMSQVRVIRAVDDTGKNLIRTNGPISRPSAKWRWYGSQAFYQLVPLKSPSTNGKPIRRLEAEVDIFSPTAANGGLVILSNATARPGEALTGGAIDKHHLTLVYHTMESFEKAHPRANRTLTVAGPGEEERFESFFPGILNDPDGAPRKRVTFLAQDPEQTLVNLGLQATDGGIIKNPAAISGSNVESLYGFDFDAKPPPSLNLVAYVAVPEATQTIRFVLENISVPPLLAR